MNEWEIELIAALDYNPQTGGLTWKRDVSKKCRKGMPAGHLDAGNRKITVALNGRQKAAHHIAWFLHFGVWPKQNLTAKDRDYSNLRIDNFEESSVSDAARLGSAGRKGSSGHPGISWDKNRNKWSARVTHQYGQKVIGRFATIEEAIDARRKAIEEVGIDHLTERSASRDNAEKVKEISKRRIIWKRVQQMAAGVTGWKDFAEFSSYLGESPLYWSLLPIDPLQPVGPGNARWVDKPTKVYDKTDTESRRAYQKQYRQQNPNLHRAYMLNRNFDMTLEKYTEMLGDQNGVCAICKKPETTIRNGKLLTLAVDHCHVSEKVRGLLCVNCNQGLGSFKDDIAALESAIQYLKRT